MRTLLHAVTTRGLRRALAELGKEAVLARRHRAGVRAARRLSLASEARLQFGSGNQPKPGWINVDLFAPSADLSLDLREDLPFPDRSVAMIYSEHLFEHLAYPVDARHLLEEARRILKPGGVLSLVVPDFGAALHAYVAGDDQFFLGHDRLRSYLLHEKPTLMHHVNYWFRQDGLHRYAYDAETLGQVLRDVGFEGVHQREFDPAIDSQRRYLVHSLYMEAASPVALPVGYPTASTAHEAV